MSGILRTLRLPAAGRAPTLMVLLPGAYMTPEQFVDAGFAEAVALPGGMLDLALPALDLAAISDGSAVAAVHREIVVPAREQGYAQVWLGGISLGGFLALAYAAEYRDAIDGLCLLAPYPGSRITQAAIAAAGGLTAWQPEPAQLADPEFRVWRWLRQRPAAFPIYCGYGADDRFAAGMARLAATLPPAAVTCIAGGHEWPVWRLLWDHFLAGGWLTAPASGEH